MTVAIAFVVSSEAFIGKNMSYSYIDKPCL